MSATAGHARRGPSVGVAGRSRAGPAWRRRTPGPPRRPARASSYRGPSRPAWTSPCESTSATASVATAGVDPRVDHREPEQPSDPDAGRPGAGDDDPRLGHRATRSPEAPARTPGEDDRRRALDVVVERRHATLVAVEEAQRVGLLEVLELDQAARPDRLRRP